MDIDGAMRFVMMTLLAACGPATRPTLDSVRWQVADAYPSYQPAAATADGDVYLAHERADTLDIWLAKRSRSDGSVEWTTTIPSAAMPHIATDRGGNLLVTGYVQTDASRAFAAVIDPQGALIWQSNIALDGNACGLAIAGSPDGHVYVTGSNPGASNDKFVSAFEADGTPRWTRGFSTGDNGLPAIGADDSTVTVTGTIVTNGTFGSTIVAAHERTFAATYIADGELGRVSLISGGAQAPAVIDSHGNVTVSDSEGLASFDRWGTKRWKISPIDATAFAVSPSDAVVTVHEDTVTAYAPDGSVGDERWLPFQNVSVAPLAAGAYVILGPPSPTGRVIALVD